MENVKILSKIRFCKKNNLLFHTFHVFTLFHSDISADNVFVINHFLIKVFAMNESFVFPLYLRKYLVATFHL